MSTTLTAIATLLGIGFDYEGYFRKVGDIRVPLCSGGSVDLAIRAALDSLPPNEVCGFAIIPTHSGRAEAYHAVEQEARAQELHAPLVFETRDPRQIIETLMVMLRKAAANWNAPRHFPADIIRNAVCAIVALQWCKREAARQAGSGAQEGPINE